MESSNTITKKGLLGFLWCSICAYISTVAVYTNLDSISLTEFNVQYEGTSFVGKTILYLANSTQGLQVSGLIVFVGLIILYWKTKTVEDKKLKMVSGILGAVFGVLYLLGTSFELSDDLKLVFESSYSVIRGFFFAAGYGFIIYASIVMIYKMVSQVNFYALADKKKKLAWVRPDRKCFLIMWGVMFFFWFLFLMCYYPASNAGDVMDMIRQFYGVDCWSARISDLISPDVLINNHHPVIHTYIIGMCLNIGKALGNTNYGMFIYAVSQTLMMSAVFVYVIFYFIKKEYPKFITVTTFVICCIWPIYPAWAITVGKDTSYGFWNLLYTLLMIMIVETSGKILKNKKYLVALFLTSILCMLTRNNGKYLIFLMTFVLLLTFSKYWKRLAAVQVCALFVYVVLFIKILLPALSISSSDTRQLLSIPFQQTARYVLEYGDEISEEDKETIDHVLKYDLIPSSFEPRHCTVKTEAYNDDATKEQMQAYYKVWFKYLLKRPGVYVKATMNTVYGYLYPDNYQDKVIFRGIFRKTPTPDIRIDNPSSLKPIRNLMSRITDAFVSMPVTAVLAGPGFVNWVLIIECGYLILIRKKRYMVAFAPALINLLVCLAAPKVATRYETPNIFVVLFLTALTVQLVNQSKREGVEAKEEN